MIDYILLEKYAKEISVLFVEDDNLIREETSELLSDIFTNVDIAVDGKDGFKKYLEYSSKNHSYYDIVLTDIKMPYLSGIELTKLIYKENKNQIIIVLSAHNETKYLMELINLGITQFIEKPMDINNFIEVIYKTSKDIYEKNNIKEEELIKIIPLNKNLFWNKELKQLIYYEEIIKLTKKEFFLIELLVSIPEKIFTNDQILKVVWNLELSVPDINNLKNLISRLKKKVPELHIENIYSFGYRITY